MSVSPSSWSSPEESIEREEDASPEILFPEDTGFALKQAIDEYYKITRDTHPPTSLSAQNKRMFEKVKSETLTALDTLKHKKATKTEKKAAYKTIYDMYMHELRNRNQFDPNSAEKGQMLNMLHYILMYYNKYSGEHMIEILPNSIGIDRSLIEEYHKKLNVYLRFANLLNNPDIDAVKKEKIINKLEDDLHKPDEELHPYIKEYYIPKILRNYYRRNK